jgi:hypothetical protein
MYSYISVYNNKYVGTLKQFSNSTYVKFELRKSLRSALITYLGAYLYYSIIFMVLAFLQIFSFIFLVPIKSPY